MRRLPGALFISAITAHAADESARMQRSGTRVPIRPLMVSNDFAAAALKKNRAFECDSPARLTLHDQ